MKKQILAVALSSLFASGMASATALPPGGGLVETTDCSVIGSNVTLNASNNVAMAYACNAAGNAVAVGACHQSGSRSSRVYQCVTVDNGPDATAGTPDDVYNDDSCPAGDGSAGAGEFTITADFVGFVASSSGGGVSANPLGGVCDEAGTAIDAQMPF